MVESSEPRNEGGNKALAVFLGVLAIHGLMALASIWALVALHVRPSVEFDLAFALAILWLVASTYLGIRNVMLCWDKFHNPERRIIRRYLIHSIIVLVPLLARTWWVS